MSKSIFFLLSTLLLSSATFAIGETTMLAGVSKAVITPSESIWMSGYASRDKPSEGKVHDLYAKALALKDSNGNRAVLLTTDIIGLPADMTERIVEAVENKTGLPRSAVLLTSSHTHSGPVIGKNLDTMYDLDEEQQQRVVRYAEDLEKKLIEVICDSLEKMQPAQLYTGTGSAKFAINRRQYNLDGISIGHNPIGPVDHDVPVLKVVGEEDNLLAVVFGYACHNTTLSFYQLCGDYAGFAQEYLEKVHPDTVAMFFSGCGGDANPNPRRELSHAEMHGLELAGAVNEVLSASMKEVEGTIRHAYTEIDLPLTPAPTRQELETQAKDANKYIRMRAEHLLKELDEEGSIPETYAYPIQVWSIGDDFKAIALAGEVVVDYALRFKHEFGDDTWVIAYANDVFAYIPSLRILREGGYEADTSMIYYGLHGPWAPQVEEIIVKKVHELVDETSS